MVEVEVGVEVQEEEVGEVGEEIIDIMQMYRIQMSVVKMVMYKGQIPNAPFVKENITI